MQIRKISASALSFPPVPLFAYLLEPVRPGFVTDPTETEKAVSARHLEHLRALHNSGRLVFAGRLLEEGGLGIVVVEAGDAAEARAAMEADPQVAEGTMRGRVTPIAMAPF